MNSADYLVLIAIVISAGIGVVRGFLREAISLATWLLALIVAWRFGDLVEPHLGGMLANSEVKPWAARVIVVLLILLIGTAVGALMGRYVRLSMFNGMDRFLGVLFGVLRGIVLLGVFVILAQVLRLDGERWWRQSLLMPYGESIANVLRALVGEEHRAEIERVLSSG